MNITEVQLDYKICEDKKEGIPVIIAAAGSSSRMGGKNKLFLPLLGVPVLARTLMAFERSPLISSVIIVTREESIKDIQLLAEKYMITKLTDIVEGGDCRQQSVINGLERLDLNEKYVLIHDGARPLVEEDTIERVVNALRDYSAVTCAVGLKDTIKEIDENGRVKKTIPRERLASVQTPQGVNVSEYRIAVKELSNPKEYTDDMSVMESAGYEIYTVEGSYRNIKITTPEDIAFAEALICREEGVCE